MNRRDTVLAFLALGAASGPLASFAQQKGKVWRVGFLAPAGRPASLETHFYGAFPRGMRELGYVEGKNLAIEWRFADGKFERLPDLAAELVRLSVDVIVAGGTPGSRAAQKATTTIPIVMASVADPVGSGLVKSLARPGGNVTGLSNLFGDTITKCLELLLDVVPKLSRVAVLVNPDNPSNVPHLKDLQEVAQRFSVTILPLKPRSAQEIGSAFSSMTKERAEAVIVVPDPFFVQQRQQIAELATKSRMPSVFGIRQHVDAGGLMSYGSNFADNFRRAATYVDKIFKGAKPGDLPVEQPTKFELVINLKTATAIGLTIPQAVMFRADEVIK